MRKPKPNPIPMTIFFVDMQHVTVRRVSREAGESSDGRLQEFVAGVTRSGMTLAMQMLAAGGFAVSGEFPGYEPHDIGEVPWPEDEHDCVLCMVCDGTGEMEYSGATCWLCRGAGDLCRLRNKGLVAMPESSEITPSIIVLGILKDGGGSTLHTYTVLDSYSHGPVLEDGHQQHDVQMYDYHPQAVVEINDPDNPDYRW